MEQGKGSGNFYLCLFGKMKGTFSYQSLGPFNPGLKIYFFFLLMQCFKGQVITNIYAVGPQTSRLLEDRRNFLFIPPSSHSVLLTGGNKEKETGCADTKK